MATIDVPAREWPNFLETFSRQHRAWLTTIEPAVAGLHQPRPLGSVTPARDGQRISAIEISFAGDSGGDIVRIDNPTSVRVRQTAAGVSMRDWRLWMTRVSAFALASASPQSRKCWTA